MLGGLNIREAQIYTTSFKKQTKFKTLHLQGTIVYIKCFLFTLLLFFKFFIIYFFICR